MMVVGLWLWSDGGVKSTNSCEVIAKILKFLGWEYIQRVLGGIENGEFEVKVNFDIENILRGKKGYGNILNFLVWE